MESANHSRSNMHRMMDMDRFGMGIDDCYLIAYFVIIFLAARGFLAKYVFIPAAQQLGAKGSKFELQGVNRLRLVPAN